MCVVNDSFSLQSALVFLLSFISWRKCSWSIFTFSGSTLCPALHSQAPLKLPSQTANSPKHMNYFSF